MFWKNAKTTAHLLVLVVSIASFGFAKSEIKILPSEVHLDRKDASHQLLLEHFEEGLAVGDLTGQATFRSQDESVARVGENGHVYAVGNGQTEIVANHDGREFSIPVSVSGCDETYQISFTNDVQPVLTKMGCNTGACHGAAAGKNGFNLSLRGYDHPSDYDAITRHANGRRVVLAAPEQSLVLIKPSMQIPHGGGQRFKKDSLEYNIIKRWLEQNAPAPDPEAKTIDHLEVYPSKVRLVQGDTQQLLVQAVYSDGSRRDVTRWVKYGTTDDGVALIGDHGKATVKGSGSAALTVWYASKVSFARVNVPYPNELDPSVFAEAPRHNYIDNAILDQLKVLNIAPSEPAGDLVFMRRAYLDTIGVLPTQQEITRFVLDESEDKRAKLIDRLLERDEFVDYWSYKWSDLLLVNSRHLPSEALWAYYRFIRNGVKENQGWDEFVRGIITAQGSNLENGAANYYVIHKENSDLTETTSQAFLGMSIMCARCHNHPMEKWTQDEYFGMANLFAQVKLKKGNRSGEIFVQSTDFGNVLHPLYNKPMKPKPLDGEPLPLNSEKNRREHLADWLTSKDNPYFARAIINRVWANFMGRGIVEAVDDLRLTNPPSNEALFSALEKDFVEHGYDIKRLIKQIMNSAAYQRSSKPRLGNDADTSQFARYYIERLPAEVILDTYSQVTGVPTNFSGYPNGWRALQLPDSSVASYFLKTFGRPIRNQTCECERQNTPTLTQSLHLSNGETLNKKLQAENNLIEHYLEKDLPLKEVMFDLYLRAMTRAPKDHEYKDVLAMADGETGYKAMKQEEKRQFLEDLVWAVLSSKEFLFNH